jgi:hypothetical protein
MTSISQTDRPAVDKSEDSDAESDIQAVGDDAETPEELLALWEEEAPEPAGGVANLVACVLTLAFGVAGMVLSLNLSLGSLTDPAPGFFPFVVSLITTVLSAAQIVLGRRGGDGEKFSRYSVTVVWGVISLLVFVAALPLIGFEIPALLLSFVWMKWLGGESWRSAILYSVLTVVAFYLIFVVALRTQLPHLF